LSHPNDGILTRTFAIQLYTKTCVLIKNYENKIYGGLGEAGKFFFCLVKPKLLFSAPPFNLFGPHTTK
jgi:hypothetical protein